MGFVGDIVGDVIGGAFGLIGQNAQNQTNRDIAGQATLASQANAQLNAQYEYDFAKNGLSWKIADAAKYGISPLAAIGANTPSFSPVVSTFDTPNVEAPLNTLAKHGQNIARTVAASLDQDSKKSVALELARKSKENDLLDVQIANAKLELLQHSTHPGVSSLPLAYRDVVNADGSVSRVPTHGGEMFGPMIWSLNNKLIPAFQQGSDALDNLAGRKISTEDPAAGNRIIWDQR